MNTYRSWEDTPTESSRIRNHTNKKGKTQTLRRTTWRFRWTSFNVSDGERECRSRSYETGGGKGQGSRERRPNPRRCRWGEGVRLRRRRRVVEVGDWSYRGRCESDVPIM